MLNVGIDWADKKHAACLVDEAGAKLRDFEFEHTQEGFERFAARLSGYAPDMAQIRIAIETRDSLLVDFLRERGYALYFLNPRKTDRFRDRHRMSHSRTDAFDAYVLADALRTDAPLFECVAPMDERMQMLRALTRTREGLVERQVAVQNELIAALKRYFPVGLKLFNDLAHPATLAFLLAYPTYAQARSVNEDALIALLTTHGFQPHQARDRARRVREALAAGQPEAASGPAAAYTQVAQSLIRQLQATTEELGKLEAQIRKCYEDHPDHDLFDSLPGLGDILGPTIAGEAGSDMSLFSRVGELKALAGTVPVTVSSGKYRSVHFRRACNGHLRRAVQLAADVARKWHPWAREIYDRAKAAGHKHARAVRAVADQLIEILYAVLRDKRPYEAEYHRRMQREHGGKVAAGGRSAGKAALVAS